MHPYVASSVAAKRFAQITLENFQNLPSMCSSGVWCSLEAGHSMITVLCFGQL